MIQQLAHGCESQWRGSELSTTHHTQLTNEYMFLGLESVSREWRGNSWLSTWQCPPIRTSLCSATPSPTMAVSAKSVSQNPLESVLEGAAGPHPLSFWLSKPRRQEDHQFTEAPRCCWNCWPRSHSPKTTWHTDFKGLFRSLLSQGYFLTGYELVSITDLNKRSTV